ncbi:MAG: ankyrin repeat domain-containing protein [Candidatus Babeliaceae bacterium]|jgi:hypothetical protein
MKKLLYFACLMPYFACAMSLKDACLRDDVLRVQALLKSDKNILHSKNDKDGFSPIHYAAGECSLKVLRLLLDIQPDVINEPDIRGNIPFIHLFLGIFSWRERVANQKKLDHYMKFAVEMRIVQKLGPTVKEQEQINMQQFENYKKAIDLFISKKANLTIANSYGKKWIDIPGLDPELSAYAHRQIQLLESAHDKISLQ